MSSTLAKKQKINPEKFICYYNVDGLKKIKVKNHRRFIIEDYIDIRLI